MRHAGHIFNVSSVGGVVATPAWSTYCATKSALETFTDALARELWLFGVRVFTVAPGYFPTEIFHKHPAFVKDGASADQAKENPSTVYTDPETQGFNSMNWIPRYSEAHGLVGDPQKLAERVYEVVTGVGLAAEVMSKYADKGWTRILCGTDSGQLQLTRLEDIVGNIKAYEPIWTSTDRQRVGLTEGLTTHASL